MKKEGESEDEKELNHSCDFCCKKYRTKGQKDCHELVHTGKRPFLCEFCGKRFSLQHNLRIHHELHTRQNDHQEQEKEQEQQSKRRKGGHVQKSPHAFPETFQPLSLRKTGKSDDSCQAAVPFCPSSSTLQQPAAYMNENLMKIKIEVDYVPAKVEQESESEPDAPVPVDVHSMPMSMSISNHEEKDETPNNNNDEEETLTPQFNAMQWVSSWSTFGDEDLKIFPGPQAMGQAKREKTGLAVTVLFDPQPIPEPGLQPDTNLTAANTNIICDICKKTFARKDSLKQHQKIHLGQKDHECIYCEKRFQQRATLTYHLTTHTGQKKCKCPHEGCDYAAARSHALNLHMRKHTRERPFKCGKINCSYSSAFKNSLKRHQRIHKQTD